jgi:hypothetical protein
MITKLQSYGVAAIVALCCSLNLNAQGYSDSDIRRIGSNRDSSSSTASNLTVTSSSNTRINDVSIIFVGQSDSRSLDNRKPSSSMYRMTREGHEASFSDVNLQTYYYVHTSNGSKSFNFGSHKRGFIYLVTLRNVDLNALRGLRADRSSDYRWTDANTNRRYGGDLWRSGCGSGRYRGLAYVNKKIRSYNKGVQIAAVMYDDNPVNIGIYQSRTSNTRIMSVLEAWKQGDDAMAIGMKTTDGSRTDELHFRGTDCVRGNGENVLATFTLKPGSGGSGGTPPSNSWTIDDCDSTSGWSNSSQNTLSISSNYREGSGSLKSVGSGTDDFRKSFSSVDGRGATALEFWYYVDDVSDLGSADQVELGSGGRADTNEYNWEISRSTLSDGWNYIRLRFSDARITGGTPDKSRLNWFRLYRSKSSTVVSRIDDIKLTGTSSRAAAPMQNNSISSLHKVFPNPSNNGELNLLLNVNQGERNATISIKNVLGQNVYTQEINNLQEGTNQRSLELSLTPAMYFIEIKTNERKQVIKWLISN